jgi:hypothetical protein
MHIGQAEAAALAEVRQALVVDAQQVLRNIFCMSLALTLPSPPGRGDSLNGFVEAENLRAFPAVRCLLRLNSQVADVETAAHGFAFDDRSFTLFPGRGPG